MSDFQGGVYSSNIADLWKIIAILYIEKFRRPHLAYDVVDNVSGFSERLRRIELAHAIGLMMPRMMVEERDAH